MILTFFISIAWLIAAFFWALSKPLTFADNLILWFVNSIFIVCTKTILTLNVGLIKVSEGYEYALTYLVWRSFLDPMLLLIAANLVTKNRKMSWKVTTISLTFFTMLLLKYIIVRVKVVTFINFNFLYVLIMYGCFLLFNLLVTHFLTRGGSDTYEDYRI